MPSAVVIIGLFIVLVLFTIGFYPAMMPAMESAESSGQLDPFSIQMMYLVPAGLFIAILAGILYYSFSGDIK